MGAQPQLSVVDEPEVGEWQYFQMTGSVIALDRALDRLREAGWVIGQDDPTPGPFDSWTVLVRRPVRPLLSTPRAAS